MPNAASRKTPIFITFIISLSSLLLGSGCANIEWHPVYSSALTGALLGGIIGYQSGEAVAGAVIGAAITGTGKLLEETDEQARKEKKAQEDKETLVVEVTNCNGSFTPVKLKKKGDNYVGPKGENYRQIPTEEQLRPFYGLPPQACEQFFQTKTQPL